MPQPPRDKFGSLSEETSVASRRQQPRAYGAGPRATLSPAAGPRGEGTKDPMDIVGFAGPSPFARSERMAVRRGSEVGKMLHTEREEHQTRRRRALGMPRTMSGRR